MLHRIGIGRAVRPDPHRRTRGWWHFAMGMAFATALAHSAVAADPAGNALRVLATAAAQEPLQASLAQLAQAAGRPLLIEYGSAAGNLRQEILDGSPFDVAILTPAVSSELIDRGLLLADHHLIARVPVALGIRGDVPLPDVSSVAALKQVLLGARSVRYARTGTSRATVDKVLATLGDVSKIHDNSGSDAPTSLGPGEYEIKFFIASEANRNTDYSHLGLVIDSLQAPVELDAVISRQTHALPAAQALILGLEGQTFRAAMAATVSAAARR